MTTFPFQLMTISLISCFNTQDQWMTLTSKVQIADGFFNAHLQYILQLFIFFTKADRFASFFQYAAAFGSLLLLVYSRVESLILDRGGHRLSPGQRAWWILRFGPMFFFNSSFKLGSIALILAMLRYNAIWLYGGLLAIWLLVHLLFNEKCLPRMGNQAGREKSIADTNVKREASDLVTQYRNLKGKNDRLSVKKLRQSELSMLSDLDERKSQDIEKMLDQMFADEKDIDFRKFLKWEITKGGSSEELAQKLEILFNEIDDGDGLLTPEELVNLEASLDHRLTVDQAEQIIKDFDTNGDGRMSLDELVFYHSSTHVT